MSDRQAKAIEQLTAVVARQAEGIELLVQSIHLLLGEEMGTDAQDEDDPHSTMDGDGLKFRGARSG